MCFWTQLRAGQPISCLKPKLGLFLVNSNVYFKIDSLLLHPTISYHSTHCYCILAPTTLCKEWTLFTKDAAHICPMSRWESSSIIICNKCLYWKSRTKVWNFTLFLLRPSIMNHAGISLYVHWLFCHFVTTWSLNF